MTSLEQTQALFWRAISHPTGVADFLAQSDPLTRELFESVFEESESFSREERIAVYANAYFYRLHDVLAESFPILHWLFGADAFNNLVTDYLLAHPSRSPSLHDLGNALPRFLKTHRSTATLPQAADTAKFELALSKALHAADHTPLSANDLSSLAPHQWGNLTFNFAPSLERVSTEWPMLETVAAYRNRGSENRTLNSLERLTPHITLVWRKAFKPHFRLADSAESATLASLLRGDTFATACDVARAHDGTPAQVAAYLKRWLHDGFVAGSHQPALR